MSFSLHRLWIAVGALSLMAAVAHAGNGGKRELSDEERAELDRGALVQRPMVERRGSLELMGGTSYQVIDAPVKVVWSALLDTEHYHRMMPRVLEAKVVSNAGSERTVFMRQGAGPFERAYYLTVRTYEERGDITFSVDERRPHNLRAAWGFYTVRPYADGTKTLLAYGVMADLDVGGIGAFLRDDMHEWLLKVPWTVKRFVEGSGRYIYKQVWGKQVAQQTAPSRG
ncbi:MAG TPA: SRPBCC family protein [Polyangiales bacterium]|nr:SRPBCC family protein [Polyangiales bacterium]